MISLKNPGQIAKMREAGKILREVEDEVREHIRPGVSTAELDILAESRCAAPSRSPRCAARPWKRFLDKEERRDEPEDYPD